MAIRLMQPGQGSAPRLPDGGLSARQRNRPEPVSAMEGAVIRDQKLASPDGPVGAVPGPIERDANDWRAFQVRVFCHAGRNVGVVMLNCDRGQSFYLGPLLRIASGQVVRVVVVLPGLLALSGRGARDGQSSL